MADFKDREHYVPLRKSDLVELLCKDPSLRPEERAPFRDFCRIVAAVWHFEHTEQLEQLKDDYAPFDPDSETITLTPVEASLRPARMSKLFNGFAALMERANFKPLSRDEIQHQIDGVPTDWGLAVHVDLNRFERIEAFARAEVNGTRKRRRWWKLFREETVQVPLYSRFVLILKQKPDPRADVNTNAVFLKVFKDVPKADVDMLLPGARAKLSRLDRVLIIYPLIAGLGLMAFNVFMAVTGGLDSTRIDNMLASFSKELSTALLSWSAALAVGGYGYKTYFSWQMKRQDYNYRLTRSLYYQTLDSNVGVLNWLIDEAEEQECRETFLAYFFLLKHAPPEGWTASSLDDHVEQYLEDKAKLKVDFEVGDALDKLEKLAILTKDGDRYRATPLNEALERIDHRWDNYFKYNNA